MIFYSPWRILEDAGGAFAMGGIGGSLWHGIKGFKNSPRVMLFLPIQSFYCKLLDFIYFRVNDLWGQ